MKLMGTITKQEVKPSATSSFATLFIPDITGDAVVLFTNDIHKHNLKTTRLTTKQITDYKEMTGAILIDSGDSLLEAPFSSLDAWDYLILGNHDVAAKEAEMLTWKDKMLSCNMFDVSSGERACEPYAKVELNGLKVAIVGVSFGQSAKVFGHYLSHNAKTGMNENLQNALDECQDCDLKIVLCHIAAGTDLQKLIAATSGADIFICGHDHKQIAGTMKNKLGEDVLYCETGTGLNALGQLRITEQGTYLDMLSKLPEKPKPVPVPPKFNYDYEVDGEFDEVTLLCSTDLHNVWKGSSTKVSPNEASITPAFNFEMMKARKTPNSLLVDCGDFGHISAGNTTKPNSCPKEDMDFGKTALDKMKDAGFFASTLGNHEFYYGSSPESKWGYSTTPGYMINLWKSYDFITACNVVKDGEPIYKPYRTARIGNHSVAVIGVACNYGEYADHIAMYDGLCTWETGDALYKRIQDYIDNDLKGFEYVGVIVHGGERKSSYAAERICIDDITANVKGLDFILGGHSHAKVEGKESNGVFFSQARCYADSYQQISLKDGEAKFVKSWKS